ncbi:hypothetical protein SAMN05216223_11633 [Actinacidiphila yanglinensis]|uniref:Penicillinase repressor n=1 Tax=Actinacidiphila yanglinensis TaxID=310779 RepID=A0A1H6DJJ9_9ACTN|nr:hypothetical protein [Actinacidiphila yanglinensis]SEG85311.1 hypothetical protein SAMN05216223_11633 [Actinacidiphila yanglinensis]
MADNATLKSQYLAKVEADLEHNAKEREHIAADLASLQEQLTHLEQDHALLLGVQHTLTSATPDSAQDTEPADASADMPATTVPRARKSKAVPRTPKASAGKKTASNTGTRKSSSSGVPTLVELVTADLLTEHSEPRSAAEVTTSLAQTHSDRKIQTTVVRNALEALVAKGQALRSKQGRAVYYSAAETTPAADAPAKNATATA